MTSTRDAWVASPRGKDTKHGYIQGSLCPGNPSKMGFFLQSVCMRKAPFKGYKNYFGGGWGGRRVLDSLLPPPPCKVLPIPRYIPGIARAESAGRALTP